MALNRFFSIFLNLHIGIRYILFCSKQTNQSQLVMFDGGPGEVLDRPTPFGLGQCLALPVRVVEPKTAELIDWKNGKTHFV